MNAINDRFFELRIKLGLKQGELADVLGVTKASVSQIESGKIGVSKKVRLILLQEYNVNPQWLDEGIGTMFMEESHEKELEQFIAEVLKVDDTDIRKRILMAIAKVPTEYWSHIAETVEIFVDTVIKNK